jgi:hypothetical protein
LPALASAPAPAVDAANHAAKVGITLLHVDTDSAEFFRVDPAAPLRKVFHNYSRERMKVPLASLRFLHGDRTLHPDDRPRDVGLHEFIYVLTKSQQKQMLEHTPNAVEVMKRGEERGDERILFDPIVQATGLVQHRYKPENVMMTISDGKQLLTLRCNDSISSLVYRGVITK